MKKVNIAKVALIVVAVIAVVGLIGALTEAIYYLFNYASFYDIYGPDYGTSRTYMLMLGSFYLVFVILAVAFAVIAFIFYKKKNKGLNITAFVLFIIITVFAVGSIIILGIYAKQPSDYGTSYYSPVYFDYNYYLSNYYFSVLTSFITITIAVAVAYFLARYIANHSKEEEEKAEVAQTACAVNKPAINTGRKTAKAAETVPPAPVAQKIGWETDILIKYKKLLDDGVITNEEFIIKKNELLNK